MRQLREAGSDFPGHRQHQAGTEDDLDGPKKQFIPLELNGSSHRCGISKLRTRTFDELTPEERQRFGIPEKASA